MAPNKEKQTLLTEPYSKSSHDNQSNRKPARLSMENLRRPISDISFELSKETIDDDPKQHLPPISEVEDAKCECCGMSEECTPEYIKRVREKYAGKLICGLCAEAVNQEMEKNGGQREAAVEEHISACVKFNRFDRTHPVLFQAEAMREILKRSSSGINRAKSMSPRARKGQGKGGIARSTSCIPSITREIGDFRHGKMAN